MLAPSDDQVDRPSIKGAYKPLRTGTIRGSIFALLASVLGTGNLNLPLRIDHLGLIPFVAVVLLTALLSYFGMYLMSKFMVRFKVVSYSEMVRKTYGVKFMRIA
jgi:amino acid permease